MSAAFERAGFSSGALASTGFASACLLSACLLSACLLSFDFETKASLGFAIAGFAVGSINFDFSAGLGVSAANAEIGVKSK